MALITRAENGEPLSITQMDNNLLYLESLAVGGGTGGGVIIKGDYTSNNDAVLNGLVTGDYYRYYDNDKDIYTLAIVKEEADINLGIYNFEDIYTNLGKVEVDGDFSYYIENMDGEILITKNTDNNKSYTFVYDNDNTSFTLGTVSSTGVITPVASNVEIIAYGESIADVTYMLPIISGLRDNGSFSATASSDYGDQNVEFTIIISNSVIVDIQVVNGGDGYALGNTLNMIVPSSAFADTSSSIYNIQLTVSELNTISGFNFISFVYVDNNNFYALGKYNSSLSVVFNITTTGVCTVVYNIENFKTQNNGVQGIINIHDENQNNNYSIFASYDSNTFHLGNGLEIFDASDSNMITFGDIPGFNAFKVMNIVSGVIDNTIYTVCFAINDESSDYFAYLGKLNVTSRKITFVRHINDTFSSLQPICLFENI